MQQSSKLSAGLLACIIVAAGFISIAWNDTPGNPGNTNNLQDSVPKRDKRMRSDEHKTVITGDLDDNLEKLNNALEKLDKKLDGKDWDKMNKQLQESLEKLNSEKMEQQIEEAMKSLNQEKIRVETEAALKKVDWNKMQQDIQKAMLEVKNSIDSKKLEAELERAFEQAKKAMAEAKNVDMDKVKAEMDEATEQLKEQQGRMKEELERARENINENLNRDIRKELEKAKEGVQRAKEELTEYKAMLGEMEKDGLLSTKENYSVEYKDGDLFINGKKQSDSTRDKYKHYFKRDNVKIKKERDNDEKIIDL